MQKWLHDNDVLMYFTQNEGKPIAAERFIRTKGEIYKKGHLMLVSIILVISIS